MHCQCGYPTTPCDKHKHDYGHDCLFENQRAGLKPQNAGLKPVNIIQAAEADMQRKRRNAVESEYRDHTYEPYAFHRKHVRKTSSPRELLILALMDPWVAANTAKENTRMIYGDGKLLFEALQICL